MHGFFAHLLISFFPFGLKHFPFYIMHQVEPPPSFSFQVDLLHLWPTFESSGDSNFCCSHGGEHIASHDIVWNPLQLHHDKHEVTSFMWTNSCPFATFPSIFLPASWHRIIFLKCNKRKLWKLDYAFISFMWHYTMHDAYVISFFIKRLDISILRKCAFYIMLFLGFDCKYLW